MAFEFRDSYKDNVGTFEVYKDHAYKGHIIYERVKHDREYVLIRHVFTEFSSDLYIRMRLVTAMIDRFDCVLFDMYDNKNEWMIDELRVNGCNILIYDTHLAETKRFSERKWRDFFSYEEGLLRYLLLARKMQKEKAA